jgi:hypothetical protein
MRTNLYSLLCIAIRFGALFVGVEALLSTLGVYEISRNPDTQISAFVLLSIILGQLVLAALLWTYPGVVARLATRKAAAHDVIESPIGAAEIQYIAFSLLGLYFFAGGVYMLVHEIARHLARQFSTEAAGYSSYFDPYAIAEAVATLAQIGLGLGLLLGARGLVGMLGRARVAGSRPTPDVSQEAP